MAGRIKGHTFCYTMVSGIGYIYDVEREIVVKGVDGYDLFSTKYVKMSSANRDSYIKVQV